MLFRSLERVDNPLTAVSPVNDYLAYLAASENVQSLGSTRSEERRVGKSVDLGGRRIMKKKKKK